MSSDPLDKHKSIVRRDLVKRSARRLLTRCDGRAPELRYRQRVNPGYRPPALACVNIGEQFSPARAARALYTCRTALNRLQRAERLLPFPLAGHGLEVGVALEIAQWLGTQPPALSMQGDARAVLDNAPARHTGEPTGLARRTLNARCAHGQRNGRAPVVRSSRCRGRSACRSRRRSRVSRISSRSA
jgi:hypothetical protein